MNLVDSSGWLEYIADTKHAKHFADAIEDIKNLLVPTICLTEVFKKVLKEKDEDTAILVISQMEQGRVIDLDETIAINAGQFAVQYKLPLADSIIYATAYQHDAVVYTMDSDFRGLENVKYFSKK